MAMIFGVNTTEKATKKLTNGYTLYEWVMRKNSNPDFWSCTLLGDNRVSEEEIEYLLGKKCKIALIMRDLTEEKISSFDGSDDALRAAEAAKELGVPANEGIVIFAEIQSNWSVSHNWMISFAQVLYKQGYIAGFIGNTDSSKNFNFGRQCSHYVEATEEDNGFGAIYWATEPKLGGEPEYWAPYCPSALTPDDIDLWECNEYKYGDTIIKEIYGKEEYMLKHMW